MEDFTMEKYEAMIRLEEQIKFSISAAEDRCRRAMFAEERMLREFYYKEHRLRQKERWGMRAEEYLVSTRTPPSPAPSLCVCTVQRLPAWRYSHPSHQHANLTHMLKCTPQFTRAPPPCARAHTR